MNYRFISDNMYIVGGGSSSIKNPNPKDGVTVTNVKPTSGNMFVSKQWTYCYKGKNYITSYAWALIEETEENLALLDIRNKFEAEKSEIDLKIKNITNQMKFVK